MEGERRKRKLENEEEGEEQQMEKFFALITSTKDVRDRLSNKEKEEEKAKGVWNPAFQPEDFIDDHQELARLKISTPLASGPSGKKKEVVLEEGLPETSTVAVAAAAAPAPAAENENREEASDQLDLTLSL